MAWPRKKPDPLSDRTRALNQEIAHLAGQIKRLGAQLERDRVQPPPSPRSASPRPVGAVAPPGAPSTKPRALNVALPALRGDLVVVYDAEDEPDPDQLRLAAAHFIGDPGLD